VCAGVAAPVLCSYVLWALGEAIGMGLQRLYFISRDGEVLLEIAQRLLSAFWPKADMELRYLHGSRQAWVVPSLTVSGQDLGPHMLQYFQNTSLKIAFSRVFLTREDVEKILPKYGFTTDDWERKFTVFDWKRAKALVEDEDLQQLVLNRAHEFRDCTLGYLEQEGLMEDVPYGMVDLGWAGGQKGALESLLATRGKAAPITFFFGRARETCDARLQALRTYHFNIGRGEGIKRELVGITVLMEIFCASLSEGLRGYELRDGKYGPLYRRSNALQLHEWGFETMRGSILKFAENLAEHASDLKSPAWLPPELSDLLLRAFWYRPTKAEARAWGQFPFEEDSSGSSHNRLVPDLKPSNFLRALLFGRGFSEYSEWNRGVIAAQSPLFAFLWLTCLCGYKTRKVIQHVVLRRKI
jgi:hypothetical protein